MSDTEGEYLGVNLVWLTKPKDSRLQIVLFWFCCIYGNGRQHHAFQRTGLVVVTGN